jgi:hypothetical protein
VHIYYHLILALNKSSTKYLSLSTYLIFYIYKRLRPRKKIRNRKKERATETLKLNTKPLKFKCGLADWGGGGGAGRPMQGMGTPT